MACQDKLYRTLRERGMRVTPQREIVVSVLHDLENHATVEEIYRRVQAHSAVMDISTVYRTLELLDALQMLDVLDAPDGQRRYALRHAHPHVHLVCRVCGGADQVGDESLAEFAAALMQQHGFVLDTRHLTLTGHCETCSDCAEDFHP